MYNPDNMVRGSLPGTVNLLITKVIFVIGIFLFNIECLQLKREEL